MWGLFCKPWNKDPVIRQPGFNGKYPAGFSFLAPLGRTGVPGLCLLELRWRWRFGPPWSTGIGTTKLYLEPFSWPLFCLEFGPTNKFQDVTNGMSSVFHCGGSVTNMNLKGPLLHRFFPKNPWWGLKNSEELVAFQKKNTPSQGPPKNTHLQLHSFGGLHPFFGIWKNLLKSGDLCRYSLGDFSAPVSWLGKLAHLVAPKKPTICAA